MFFIKKFGNKSLEFIMFKKAWDTYFSLDISLTGQNHYREHWGFEFCLVILGYKILEFNFTDIRHQDDLVDDEDDVYI